MKFSEREYFHITFLKHQWSMKKLEVLQPWRLTRMASNMSKYMFSLYVLVQYIFVILIACISSRQNYPLNFLDGGESEHGHQSSLLQHFKPSFKYYSWKLDWVALNKHRKRFRRRKGCCLEIKKKYSHLKWQRILLKLNYIYKESNPICLRESDRFSHGENVK